MHIAYIWKPERVHFQQLWAITLQGKKRPNGFLHATALRFWAARVWNLRAPKFHSQSMGQLDGCGTLEHQRHTATCCQKQPEPPWVTIWNCPLASWTGVPPALFVLSPFSNLHLVNFGKTLVTFSSSFLEIRFSALTATCHTLNTQEKKHWWEK